MDSSGNTVDRFSIVTESASPKYAEYSSNTLKVYSGSNRYAINTSTHTFTKNSFTYNIDTPQIEDQTYWRILQYADYRFGLTSNYDGILVVFNNEDEKLATYYGKLSFNSLTDACVSGQYLYFTTGGGLVQRIDLDELTEDMLNAFF